MSAPSLYKAAGTSSRAVPAQVLIPFEGGVHTVGTFSKDPVWRQNVYVKPGAGTIAEALYPDNGAGTWEAERVLNGTAALILKKRTHTHPHHTGPSPSRRPDRESGGWLANRVGGLFPCGARSEV